MNNLNYNLSSNQYLYNLGDNRGKIFNNKLSSNIHIQKRFYSCQFYTQVTKTSIVPLILNPWFITGFTDAEGCFNVSVSKRINTIRYEVQARFIIELQLKDIDILLKIQSFFSGVGTISKNLTKNSCRYSVVSIVDINKFIIPHFKKYPLQSVKSIDFDLWSQIINLLNDKKHLTPNGIIQIVSLKSIMNFGLSKKLKLVFSNLIFLERKEYKPDNNKLNPYWISGFISGDGSFFITINKNNRVSAWLSIGLNARDKHLLDKIQNFFSGKGGIYFSNSKYNGVVE